MRPLLGYAAIAAEEPFPVVYQLPILPMAGHNKWSKIKRQKAVTDARRSKAWARITRDIMVASREGGGDPNMNARLALCLEKAKSANMPKDNIERAIAKGTGELDGATYSELVYEGYAPGQVAVVIDILTDNKNRTASELRKIFDKQAGATLGNPGAVSWMFETKGVIEIPVPLIDEDQLMELALEAGAEDVKIEGEVHQILTAPEGFSAVRSAIEEKEIEPSLAEVTRIPTTTVVVDELDLAQKVVNFISDLEDHDDVQTVHTNFDIPDEILDKLE